MAKKNANKEIITEIQKNGETTSTPNIQILSMQIESHNRQQLKKFIESDFFKKSYKIPISHHRALSHTHNPDCADDDILLWVAYDNDLLAGYVGILPGICHLNGIDEKIYWLSCFWVNEPYRKRNIASMLFFQLIREYKERLFISNFIPVLEKTYQSLGIFQPTVHKKGYRFYVQFCFAEIVVSRTALTSLLKPVSRWIDNFLNLFFEARVLFYKKLKENFKVVEDCCFDEEFQSLIDSFRTEKSYIKRDSAHFDWILNHPWILQGKPDKESRRYFFSSRSSLFKYCSLKIYENENLLGYVLLKIRDISLTVSYLYADSRTIKDIAIKILKKANEEKLKTITVFDKRLADEISKNRSRYIFSKEIKQLYVVTKDVDITSFSFQDGDGDGVFT
jgi:GNAT superfamily N-acetyltransferase